MSDTIFTPIVTTGWTQVSAGISGTITNASGQDILYIEAAATPLATLTKGHALRPQDSVSYNLQTGQEVYARSIATDSEIVVTQNSFSKGGNSTPTNLFFEIARGLVPGQSTASVLAFNPDVDLAAEETVWDQGGLYTYLTANTELFVSSSSTSDTNVGLKIEGMTDDFVIKDTLFTFTGGQVQQSIGNFFRIFKIAVISGAEPAGDLYVAETDTLTAGVPDTASKIKAKVIQGINVTRIGLITVPANNTMFIVRLATHTRKGKDSVSKALIRPDGFPGFMEITQFPTFESSFGMPLDPPFVIDEKTDIEIRALTETNNTQAAASFAYILVDNTIA
ncbi:MAG: hypothetical protein JKX85_04930 [Phycisphaeraceae bacterium]|nr:hypothetical protein [Phycisphaeraceae bacterium]